MLVQLQLSNYTREGLFDLACDSGWQMVINRAREMLKLDADLRIDVLGPERHQLIADPERVTPDVTCHERVRYVEQRIEPNAIVTRYDFNMEHVVVRLNLRKHRLNPELRYDVVIINDPMLLRHFRTAFFIYAGYLPKFVVHSHFVDATSNPKFPTEVSLWLGQCEAALKADWNFWQCQSAFDEFIDEMSHTFTTEHVNEVCGKSSPYDDGYSIEEMNMPIDERNLRFDVGGFTRLIKDRPVVFVPNRIGGRGRSSDYTQCGRFMFEVLPKLHRLVPDLVVLAGNPNQKFSNDELVETCGKHGYVKLVDGAFNRDEYRWIARELGRNAGIVVGLYNADCYGSTASRECIEMGMMPFWCDNYEYATVARSVGVEATTYLCRPDLSNAAEILSSLLHLNVQHRAGLADAYRSIVRKVSSFEKTTPAAYAKIREVCGVA